MAHRICRCPYPLVLGLAAKLVKNADSLGLLPRDSDLEVWVEGWTCVV